MKKIFFFIITLFSVTAVSAQQEFAKHLADARSAYAAGKLDDSRFAMQQMLQELDIITGKEVLKALPIKMMNDSARKERDEVSGTSGFVGVLIHREYGAVDSLYNRTTLEIISNSPLLGSLNAMLSLPFMGNNPDQKVIKVAGYKALVQKVNDKEYEVQLPLNNSLITLRAPGKTQEEVIKMMNTVPVAEIAKMLQ